MSWSTVSLTAHRQLSAQQCWTGTNSKSLAGTLEVHRDGQLTQSCFFLLCFNSHLPLTAVLQVHLDVADSYRMSVRICTAVTHQLYLTVGSNNKSSPVAEVGNCLATIDIGQKVWAAVPISVGELGLRLTQCDQDRGLPPYQVMS